MGILIRRTNLIPPNLSRRINTSHQKHHCTSVKQLLRSITLNPGAQSLLFSNHIPLDALTLKTPQSVYWYRGGINAGKSWAGALFLVTRALQDPQARGLISANSYGQLTSSTLVVLAEFCQDYGIELDPWEGSPEETARAIANRHFCRVAGAPVYALSAEAFTGRTRSSAETGRGTKFRHMWLDEFSYAQSGAMDTLVGRLGRGRGTGDGVILMTSSINKNDPFNWAYRLFDDPDRPQSTQATYACVAGSSLENQFIEDGFLERIKAAYTDELYRVEILSEYVAITTGRIFKYFTRDRHCMMRTPSPHHPIHVSFDFNHNPSVALVAQFIDGEIWIIKEWYLENSSTFESSESVTDWLLSSGTRLPIEVHGDASGEQKSSNSFDTNWDIVFSTLHRGGFTTHRRVGNCNPGIQNSIHSCNAALRQNLIAISPLCTELIMDLEGMKYADSGGIDKRDLSRSHLGDAFRYLVHDLLPFRAHPSPASTTPRPMPVGVF